MAIPQHTIDQILDRTDLVDLIGKYVKLKKSGRSYSGCCPFHQEKTPSFHVYRDKQYYHCFGCQANGNAIKFLMEYESRSFPDVMKQLASETGIDLPKDDFEQKKSAYKRNQTTTYKNSSVDNNTIEYQHLPADVPLTEADYFVDTTQHFNDNYFLPDETFMPSAQEEGNLYDLLEYITQYYQQQLWHNAQAQAYFSKRGLSKETIQAWRLGYAPDGWQHLQQTFPQDIEGLKLLGLIRTSNNGRDFCLLRDRVIFPIRDSKGRVVGFGGRALNDETKPKYINSPDSDIFHKNQLLYGLYEGSKQKAKDWLMVEGYMDVIALQQNGIHGAVATLGTASNAEHLSQLFKRNPRLTLAFDGDQAGQKAAQRTLEIALPLLTDGRELQFFVLPAEHDPDSLIRQYGVEHFKQLWQQSPLLSDFLFSLLSQHYDISTPEGKSLVMGDLKPLTDLLPKYNSFKYLLTQSFKEKLGLAWRFNRKTIQQQDASLSFNSPSSTEDHVIAILIQYPSLYTRFEMLRAVINPNLLLSDILTTLHYVYEHLPDDAQAQSYYMLGACANYQYEINQIIQRVPLAYLQDGVEKIDRLAHEYSLTLQSKYLKEHLKSEQAKNIKTLAYLREQLNVIQKQILFRDEF
ncbi:DNA primase [Moraxella sp. ZY210820]|uniref:DNA primase n=1 Tax=unclassified Moraxella TaxID=2685852 RepID=UPI0027300FC0|nr:CHC2 zinc finger domain-containing protein [Moraxella sp. ZY210820]WLF84976.1 CHC2 zinc finger domain-containing protein [Moraxella sp. ZY210820]